MYISEIPGDRVSKPLLTLTYGEYTLHKGIWYGVAPEPVETNNEYITKEFVANLSNHKVIEHDDGTITVEPSILITVFEGDKRINWHGYLQRGVWKRLPQ